MESTSATEDMTAHSRNSSATDTKDAALYPLQPTVAARAGFSGCL